MLDENDRAIAQLIISLADNLNLEMIAGGVETQEQQVLLAQMGCHRYQGYYFGRPQPLVQLKRRYWLTKSASFAIDSSCVIMFPLPVSKWWR